MPGLRFVDAAAGALGIEWIDGKSIRSLLGSGEEETEDEDVSPVEEEDFLAEYRVPKGMTSLTPSKFLISDMTQMH